MQDLVYVQCIRVNSRCWEIFLGAGRNGVRGKSLFFSKSLTLAALWAFVLFFFSSHRRVNLHAMKGYCGRAAPRATPSHSDHEVGPISPRACPSHELRREEDTKLRFSSCFSSWKRYPQQFTSLQSRRFFRPKKSRPLEVSRGTFGRARRSFYHGLFPTAIASFFIILFVW